MIETEPKHRLIPARRALLCLVSALCAGWLTPGVAASLQPFAVVSPNGGETFVVGDTLTATVGSDLSSSLCVLSVDIGPYIFAFPGQATQFRPAAAPIHKFVIPAYFVETADTGTGPFLDSTSTVSDEWAIQLADYSMPDNNDLSDSNFSVIAAPIVITSAPVGLHNAGDQLAVSWRAADRIPGCTVALSTDNSQTWTSVTAQAITRQSPSWRNLTFAVPVGAGTSLHCAVRVTSSDGSYQAVSTGTSNVADRPTGDHELGGWHVSAAAGALVATMPAGDVYELSVYDSRGLLVLSRRIANGGAINISTNSFAPGLHVVRIRSAAHIVWRSLVINR